MHNWIASKNKPQFEYENDLCMYSKEVVVLTHDDEKDIARYYRDNGDEKNPYWYSSTLDDVLQDSNIIGWCDCLPDTSQQTIAQLVQDR